ncbi:MAG: 2-C-methyl-D-erythritol 4-phosphate cytidylyltransferase, partial [Sulfurimonas sp.]
MNVAVILSAGNGSRFGGSSPKQFLNLAGKNIIEYTLEAFEQNKNIDEICIVANKEYHSKIKIIVEKNNFVKIKKIISGGKERKDSSYAAIKAYENQKNVNLIFHDAVRPFVSQRILNETIKALEYYDAVDVAIPTSDTIIQIDTDTRTIEQIPQRSKLQRGQTPQAFKLTSIKRAHELSNQDKNEPQFSDDCGLIKQYLPQTKIYIVAGEEKNIKITYPQDLLFAEKLIQLHSIVLDTTINFELLKGRVIVVFGGNNGIGKEIAVLCEQYNAIVYPLSRSNNIDITQPQNIKKALHKIYEKEKRIDIIINCAAILEICPLKEMDDASIFQQINTNFTSNVIIAKEAFDYLYKTSGSLILFTSSSYTSGRENYSIYSSTKAA